MHTLTGLNKKRLNILLKTYKENTNILISIILATSIVQMMEINPKLKILTLIILLIFNASYTAYKNQQMEVQNVTEQQNQKSN